ncbi:MAG: energy transducer TonB, partial [Candidatus Acidiferrales bacterium]
AAHRNNANISAPEIAARAAGGTLIALSATPAPAPPPPVLPAGNLSARISISPDGPRPGTPGASDSGNVSSGASETGGRGRGPEGIFISRGSAAKTGPVSGLGIGSAARGLGSPLASRPIPRERSDDSSRRTFESGEGKETSKLDMPPEKVLAGKQTYTLHVNMPNLTSASGSWVLNFAELDDEDASPFSTGASSQIAAPVPLRKVDPKYPPELRDMHVDGDVILYAIIRKDGSVDSIQLVHSVDPQLDTNAMQALAQWIFRPAEKNGRPVDLEAVVRIPFRSRVPGY